MWCGVAQTVSEPCFNETALNKYFGSRKNNQAADSVCAPVDSVIISYASTDIFPLIQLQLFGLKQSSGTWNCLKRSYFLIALDHKVSTFFCPKHDIPNCIHIKYTTTTANAAALLLKQRVVALALKHFHFVLFCEPEVLLIKNPWSVITAPVYTLISDTSQQGIHHLVQRVNNELIVTEGLSLFVTSASEATTDEGVFATADVIGELPVKPRDGPNRALKTPAEDIIDSSPTVEHITLLHKSFISHCMNPIYTTNISSLAAYSGTCWKAGSEDVYDSRYSVLARVLVYHTKVLNGELPDCRLLYDTINRHIEFNHYVVHGEDPILDVSASVIRHTADGNLLDEIIFRWSPFSNNAEEAEADLVSSTVLFCQTVFSHPASCDAIIESVIAGAQQQLIPFELPYLLRDFPVVVNRQDDLHHRSGVFDFRSFLGANDNHHHRRRGVALYSVFVGNNSNNPAYTGVLRVWIPNIPHYFLTDNPDIGIHAEEQGWTVIRVPGIIEPDEVESGVKGKLPKAFPSLYTPLDSFKYLIYIDAKRTNTVTVSQLERQLQRMGENPSWAMMFNPKPRANHTVIDEFLEALNQPRYLKSRDRYSKYIHDRLVTTRAARGSEDDGSTGGSGGNSWPSSFTFTGGTVLRSGFIIRDMDHPMTDVIGAKWYSEILESGCQCQISLSFIYDRYREFIGLTDEMLGWILI